MSLEKKELKHIIYIFILIDTFLMFYITLEILFYLIGYEASLIFGFLLGIRGQGRYKEIMLNLNLIARNKRQTLDEREHKLVMAIHHACLELGYLFEERNIKYGLKFKENNKKEKHRNIKKEIKRINKKIKKIKKGDKKK